MDDIISYTIACTRYLHPLGFTENLIKIIAAYCADYCSCKCDVMYCTFKRAHNTKVELHKIHLCDSCFKIIGNYDIRSSKVELVCNITGISPKSSLTTLINHKGNIPDSIIDHEFFDY